MNALSIGMLVMSAMCFLAAVGTRVGARRNAQEGKIIAPAVVNAVAGAYRGMGAIAFMFAMAAIALKAMLNQAGFS